MQEPFAASPQEAKAAASLAETIEQQQGNLSLREVRKLLELGVHGLPRIEGGGKLHGSTEAQNKAYRIDYLQEHLGIDTSAVPKPSAEGKFLSERLVADTLMDTIGLCHTIEVLINERDRLMALNDPIGNGEALEQVAASIQLLIDTQNQETQLRLLKGAASDLPLGIDGSSTNPRALGQEHGYFPARSLDLMRAGYAGKIYGALETALAAKQPPPAQ